MRERGFFEQVSFKLKPQGCEGFGLTENLGAKCSWQGISECKGPEAAACLAHLKNGEAASRSWRESSNQLGHWVQNQPHTQLLFGIISFSSCCMLQVRMTELRPELDSSLPEVIQLASRCLGI